MRRSRPAAAALAGALLLTWTERKRPEVQEALIGILFVLASTAQILLLANDPHGGDNLKDLLAGQILWVSNSQLIRTAVITAVFALVWFTFRERIGRVGFYVLFALVVTASVQLVGVYLVFTTLIVPAVATYRHAPKRQLMFGYALAIGSYVVGLGVSVVTDLPSSPVIVWAMGVLGLLVHLTGEWKKRKSRSPCGTAAARIWLHAPVAQLDRALGFEPSGRRFESVRARHHPMLSCQLTPNLSATHANSLLKP